MNTIWFDMDGTIADLYGVEQWLNALQEEDTAPYVCAKPLCNFSAFARLLHRVQRNGYQIGIVSWTAKNASDEFQAETEIAKRRWLSKHLPSIEWDFIEIFAYGTPKSTVGNGILFDDEERNRNEWNGIAFEPSKIFEILRSL